MPLPSTSSLFFLRLSSCPCLLPRLDASLAGLSSFSFRPMSACSPLRPSPRLVVFSFLCLCPSSSALRHLPRPRPLLSLTIAPFASGDQLSSPACLLASRSLRPLSLSAPFTSSSAFPRPPLFLLLLVHLFGLGIGLFLFPCCLHLVSSLRCPRPGALFLVSTSVPSFGLRPSVPFCSFFSPRVCLFTRPSASCAACLPSRFQASFLFRLRCSLPRRLPSSSFR